MVLPQGEDGWYINSPVEAEARYEDYLLEAMRAAAHGQAKSYSPFASSLRRIMSA
jgi:hypothetical protein